MQPKTSFSHDALTYVIELGWYVFPAPPGEKKSYKRQAFSKEGKRWGATNDPRQVAKDFKKWSNANIGIPTGKDNGIWVLDIDNKPTANGYASLAELEAQYGKLPDTLQATSPSGGVHYYFTYPSNVEIHNNASQLGTGIDVRGEGGMVVAPPSVKPGVGAYEWLNTNDIADAPAWLVELVKDNPLPPSTIPPAHIDDTDELIAALMSIPADLPRNDWFAIGCALYSIAGEAAWSLFDCWSRTAPAVYDAKVNRKDWDSIAKMRRSYSAGTIFYYAKKYNNNHISRSNSNDNNNTTTSN
jgi:hypothetical protein